MAEAVYLLSHVRLVGGVPTGVVVELPEEMPEGIGIEEAGGGIRRGNLDDAGWDSLSDGDEVSDCTRGGGRGGGAGGLRAGAELALDAANLAERGESGDPSAGT